MAHRLSCSSACGIFLDQGSNRCLRHWQADSSPLSHQGSPALTFKSQLLPDADVILHSLSSAYLFLPNDLATLFTCFSDLRVFALAVLSVQNALTLAFCHFAPSGSHLKCPSPLPDTFSDPQQSHPHLASSITFMCFVVFLAFITWNDFGSQTRMKVFLSSGSFMLTGMEAH